MEITSAPESSFRALNLGSGMVYSLRRAGRRVVSGPIAHYLGPEYAPDAVAARSAVRIDVDRLAPAGALVVARARVADNREPGDALVAKTPPIRGVTVSVGPGDTRP